MNATVDKKANCLADVHVEVPAESVKKRRQAVVQRFRQLAKVPGFRPGKVPAQVIERRYADDIDSEVREALLGEGLRHAAKEHKLEVLGVQGIDDAVFQPDGAFTFKARLTLEPEFTLPDYMSIPVQAPPLGVTDEMVNARIEELREQFADFKDAGERKLEDGDIAVISYAASLDGQPLKEALPDVPDHLAARDDHWLRTDEDALLPGLGAKIVGMGVGDVQESAEIAFGDDFAVTDLAGKTVGYRVELKGIKERELPELNDDFARRLIPDKGIDELRDLLRQRLEEEQQNARRNLIGNQVLAWLDQQVQTELPADVLQRETQRRVDEIVHRGLSQGVDQQAIQSEQDKIFATASQQARGSVKASFVLEKIAEKEEIRATQPEIAARVYAMAERAGQPTRKYLKQLEKEHGLGGISNQIALGKTLDFLIDHAEVTEVEPKNEPEA